MDCSRSCAAGTDSRKLWPILGLIASLILLVASAFVWLFFGSVIA
jgi:hypothetical protein